MNHLCTTPTQSLMRHASLIKVGHHDELMLGPIMVSGGNVLFLKHSDASPSSETKPKVDNLVVANMRSYPLSCTTALVGISSYYS